MELSHFTQAQMTNLFLRDAIGQADEVVMGSFPVPGGIDNGLDSAPDFDFEQD